MERVTSIPITNDINVAIFKVHVSGSINNYIIFMECKYNTTKSSTMHEIIVNIECNIYLAIKDSLDTQASKICTKCKQSKCLKLKQTFSIPLKILMVIINRFDHNNRKLNNVMCIIQSINIDSHQANLKTFTQHYETTQNVHYTSIQCSTQYHPDCWNLEESGSFGCYNLGYHLHWPPSKRWHAAVDIGQW